MLIFKVDFLKMIEGHNVIIQVAWKPIQNKAPDLWKFLDAFNFRYTEYISLLEHYNKVGIFNWSKLLKPLSKKANSVAKENRLEKNINMDEIACSWLLHNHNIAGFVEPWWKSSFSSWLSS